MMRIGYAKLGRSMKFDKSDFGFQGDAEAANLLRRLAARNRSVEWVLIGRNDAGSMFDGTNVSNPWRDYDSRADNAEKKLRLCQHTRTVGSPRTTACEPSTWELDIIRQMSELDGMVMHIGQHAPLHMHIPQANKTWQDYIDDWTVGAASPYDWALIFGGYLMRGLRALGDRTNGEAPVVYIVTDPRNKIKARDIKWPTGCDSILSQYHWDTTRPIKHERFMDPRPPSDFPAFAADVEQQRDGELWATVHKYRYGGLETMMLPDDWQTQGSRCWSERKPVGIATTSFRAVLTKERRRSELVRDIVLGAFPDAEVYGKWDKISLEDVPEGTVRLNKPHEFEDILASWRCTLALPALGTSWTVSKVYQAFAARTACFMLGRLDDQGWLLPSRRATPGTKMVGGYNGQMYYSIRDDWTAADFALAGWLRVDYTEEFRAKAWALINDESTWNWVVSAQRQLLQRRWDERLLENTIEERMGLHVDGPNDWP